MRGTLHICSRFCLQRTGCGCGPTRLAPPPSHDGRKGGLHQVRLSKLMQQHALAAADGALEPDEPTMGDAAALAGLVGVPTEGTHSTYNPDVLGPRRPSNSKHAQSPIAPLVAHARAPCRLERPCDPSGRKATSMPMCRCTAGDCELVRLLLPRLAPCLPCSKHTPMHKVAQRARGRIEIARLVVEPTFNPCGKGEGHTSGSPA